MPKLPFHLAHKPLIAVPYADLDGPYIGNTDAFYLSLGIAQWASESEINPDLSAKVWRHSEARWSRQSEELPLHRPIDLTILISVALKQASTGRVHLPAETFEKQENDLDLPVYGSFQETDAQRALLRRRLKSLVRTIATQHPDIFAEGLNEALEAANGNTSTKQDSASSAS